VIARADVVEGNRVGLFIFGLAASCVHIYCTGNYHGSPPAFFLT
jgi:hypothetical protein